MEQTKKLALVPFELAKSLIDNEKMNIMDVSEEKMMDLNQQYSRQLNKKYPDLRQPPPLEVVPKANESKEEQDSLPEDVVLNELPEKKLQNLIRLVTLMVKADMISDNFKLLNNKYHPIVASSVPKLLSAALSEKKIKKKPGAYDVFLQRLHTAGVDPRYISNEQVKSDLRAISSPPQSSSQLDLTASIGHKRRPMRKTPYPRKQRYVSATDRDGSTIEWQIPGTQH